MAKLALGMAELAVVLLNCAALVLSMPQKILLKTPQLNPKLSQDAKQARASKWQEGPNSSWLAQLGETSPFPSSPKKPMHCQYNV